MGSRFGIAVFSTDECDPQAVKMCDESGFTQDVTGMLAGTGVVINPMAKKAPASDAGDQPKPST